MTDSKTTISYVTKEWDENIIPALSKYIAIPNQSPAFDKEVLTNAHQDAAVKLLVDWVKAQQLAGLSIEVVQDAGRTPVIFIEVAAAGAGEKESKGAAETVLMYGHMDKQPPLLPWAEGLHPHKPVIRDGKLYGRGGADDGYAVFAAVTALKALHAQKKAHSRIVILIEACEESGSPDLPHYIGKLEQRIGVPSLVVCLDSGAGNYQQLWLTTSLRGLALGTLRVEILRESVHSGLASGIVPSSFRIIRQLLDRIEDSKTGVVIAAAHVQIPEEHKKYATECAETLGDQLWKDFPFVEGARPSVNDLTELILNRTWRPTLSVTGADGIPAIKDAGNVLRSQTALRLSIRVPPTADAEAVLTELKQILEKDPPNGAKVTFETSRGNGGWCAPALAPWLDRAVQDASNTYYGKPVRLWGEGGSIPFMRMLGLKFPKTQFVVTGLLGPNSNAHGPNEFLHIDFAHKLTACVVDVLAAHHNHFAAAAPAAAK